MRLRPALAVSLTVGLLGPSLSAQTLTVTNLAQGATASFDCGSNIPGSINVLVIGFAGTGASIPLDPDAIFDLLPPTVTWGFEIVPANGVTSFSLPVPSIAPLVSLSAQAVELSLLGAAIDWRTSNAVVATIAPIDTLSDDFASGSLDPSWSVLHAQLGSVTVTGGELVLTPTAAGLPDMWFDDGEGLAVLREVTGDFEMTCEVRVHDAGNPSAPPPIGYRLGGLLIRDASPAAIAPGTHEWCHVATGAGGAGQATGVERKETHASQSTWSFAPGPSTHRELRLVRTGNSVTSWHRDVGASVWLQVGNYTFVNLPTTVQAGMMSYSFSSPPRVTARFAYVRFAQ